MKKQMMTTKELSEAGVTHDNLKTENKRLRDALESILDGLEQMPQLNEEIVNQVMRGDHTLECEIGGDEASFSSWTAIARMALNPT